jgi:hypothetical protein
MTPLRHAIVLKFTALAALCLVATPSWADCTLKEIARCTQVDPLAAERLLLQDISAAKDPIRLRRVATFYNTAPLSFRNPMRARRYQRWADALDGTTANQRLNADITADSTQRAAPAEVATAPAAPPSKTKRVPAAPAHVEASVQADTASVAQLPDAPQPVVDAPPPLADAPPPATDAPRQFIDPPSTLAGDRVTVDVILNVAYAAGFRTEDQLLAAASVAIAESSLWTAARNWHPEKGLRPATDVIAVTGPKEAWHDGRQLHSDRGLWQIATWAWAQYPDSVTDDPVAAAAAAFILSRGGVDFAIWDSYSSGRAQMNYDGSVDGWPPLRPIVKRFLANVDKVGVVLPRVDAAAADVRVLPKAEVDAAASAMSSIKEQTQRLQSLADVSSLNVVLIDMSTRFDGTLSTAITASQNDADGLRALLRQRDDIARRLEATKIPIYTVLAIHVAADGGVVVYAQSTRGADPGPG